MSKPVLSVATQFMVMAIVISVIFLFVGIGVLVVIHACIAGRAFRRGFGGSDMVERGGFGNTSMSQDYLEKLPCFDFIVKSKGSSPVDCAVCLENFKSEEVLILGKVIRYVGGESNCFSESGHVSENAMRLREDQVAETGHLTDPVVPFLPETKKEAMINEMDMVLDGP
ncbi:unnamed protein product [Ilex paraguariensis]|uniref:Uncharacterized protein n=1 Tax=Ilex paraguariensis TaxID=185542 RepID=A0ABC8SYR7_9AQUA